MPVIVQCKHEGSKIGPAYIRELEGTLLHQPSGTIGVFASSSEFSSDGIQTFNAMTLPAALAHITPDHTASQLAYGAALGADQQLHWRLAAFAVNPALRRLQPRLVIARKFSAPKPVARSSQTENDQNHSVQATNADERATAKLTPRSTFVAFLERNP